MGVCDYVINIVAAFIAIEYMDHGFEKRYSCIKHRILFAMGCGVYFFVITQINYRTNYEGILCLLYGGIVTLYGVLALKGSIQDKVFLGFLWILIVLFGTFIIYGIVGIVTEKNIKTLLELESRKKDQEQHGFGMETIYSIIKKYDGRYNYRDEENSFIQEIYLNINKV